MGLDYFPMVLFETVPHLYAELEESLADLYGARPGSKGFRTSAFRFAVDWRGSRWQIRCVTAASTRDAADRAAPDYRSRRCGSDAAGRDDSACRCGALESRNRWRGA